MSANFALVFLIGVMLGVLAGAELTVVLLRLAGKRPLHQETLPATFRRLFSILLS
jgi:hypothetical protein